MSSSVMMRYSSPSMLTSLPAYDVNRTRSPSFTWKLARLPLSSNLPSPRLRTFPCFGFSLAVSGRTMPPAVFSSASRRLTTILSFKGTTFMPRVLLVGVAWKNSEDSFVRAAVKPHQSANHRVQHHVLADRLGDHAVRPGLVGSPHQLFVGVGGDEDARQQGVDLPHQLDRLQPGQAGHVHVEQEQVHRLLAYDV